MDPPIIIRERPEHYDKAVLWHAHNIIFLKQNCLTKNHKEVLSKCLFRIPLSNPLWRIPPLKINRVAKSYVCTFRIRVVDIIMDFTQLFLHITFFFLCENCSRFTSFFYMDLIKKSLEMLV